MAKNKGNKGSWLDAIGRTVSPAYALYKGRQDLQNKLRTGGQNPQAQPGTVGTPGQPQPGMQQQVTGQQGPMQPQGPQGFAPGWPAQQGGGMQGPQAFPVDAKKNWYTGTEPYTLRTPIYGQQQGAGFAEALQMALEGLRNNKLDFGPIAQQARTNFAQQTIPSIAERFSGLGAQKSSAFGQTLGQAGAGLESNLAAQQSQYGLESNRALQNLLGIGLTPQYETSYSGGREGEGSKAVNSAIQGIIKFLGSYLSAGF
jgi:hypothetical protein